MQFYSGSELGCTLCPEIVCDAELERTDQLTGEREFQGRSAFRWSCSLMLADFFFCQIDSENCEQKAEQKDLKTCPVSKIASKVRAKESVALEEMTAA